MKKKLLTIVRAVCSDETIQRMKNVRKKWRKLRSIDIFKKYKVNRHVQVWEGEIKGYKVRKIEKLAKIYSEGRKAEKRKANTGSSEPMGGGIMPIQTNGGLTQNAFIAINILTLTAYMQANITKRMTPPDTPRRKEQRAYMSICKRYTQVCLAGSSSPYWNLEQEEEKLHSNSYVTSWTLLRSKERKQEQSGYNL